MWRQFGSQDMKCRLIVDICHKLSLSWDEVGFHNLGGLKDLSKAICEGSKFPPENHNLV